MGDAGPNLIEKFNSRFTAPLTVLFTAVTVVFGFFLNANTHRLNDLQTKVETELRQREFRNNLKLNLLNEVKDAVSNKNKDTVIMKLTLLYVNALLIDSADSAYKESLKTILLSAGESRDLVATQNIIDTFKNLQAYMPVANNKFNVDIFYLDDYRAEAMQRAEAIKDELVKQYGAEFNVRVRNLPPYINAQEGYRLDANTIRYEEVEIPQAQKVYNMIITNNLLSNNPPTLELTTYHSPNYISVFVKNN
jgi:hypothetical protein